MPWTRGEVQGFKRLRRVPGSRLSVLPPVKTARRTPAAGPSSNAFCSVFSPLKLSGVTRRLSLAAGKNSAPRVRKPQPRCNVDQAAEQKRHGHPFPPARSGCGQRALSASNSSPDVKTQPPGTPSRKFQSTEGQQKTALPSRRFPHHLFRRPPGGIARRPETVRGA